MAAGKLYWPDKDPEDKADIDVLWEDWIEDGDNIVSSTFTKISGNVSLSAQSYSATATKVWLSGGALGETCEILNHVVLASGREFDQTGYVKIRKR